MTLNLYKNYSEDVVVSKSISNEVSVDGHLRKTSEMSITDPIFEITDFDGAFDYNYAYVEKFDRYYFIRDIQVGPTGIITIMLHVDVLMSKQSEWFENTGYIDTSMNYGNFYLYDPETPIQQNTKLTTVKQYPSIFNGYSIVMNCTGTTVVKESSNGN